MKVLWELARIFPKFHEISGLGLLLILATHPILAEEKSCAMVLCMHRTGSSLCARALQALGFDLGSNLIRQKKDNPKGFFEDADILKYNLTLLYINCVHSASILNIKQPIPRQDILVAAGEKLLRNKLSRYPCFAFKDPRTARNAMVWREVIPRSTTYFLSSAA